MSELNGARTCSSCKAEIDSDAVFCNECGSMQPPSMPPEQHCPGCGGTVSTSDRFCRSCAFSLIGAGRKGPGVNGVHFAATAQPPKSPFVAENVHERSDGSAGEYSENVDVFVREREFPDYVREAIANADRGGGVGATSTVLNRYKDGYLVAKTLDGFGRTLKVLGAVIGGGIMFFGFIVGSTFASAASSIGGSVGTGAGSFFFFLFSFGIWGAVIGGIFWVMGTLVSAQGQVLKAQLDGAVHSSPFMSDVDKARVMSLPPEVAQH